MFWIEKESTMNIYVGNLSFEVTEQDLQQSFDCLLYTSPSPRD